MTVASVGSLLGGRNLLRAELGKRPDNANPRPVEDEAIQQSLDRASEWLAKNFTLDKARGEADPGGGRWFYFYLHLFERFAALAGTNEINGTDWYALGSELLLERQRPDGSWIEGEGPEVNTAFAVLFLVRSTAISLAQEN